MDLSNLKPIKLVSFLYVLATEGFGFAPLHCFFHGVSSRLSVRLELFDRGKEQSIEQAHSVCTIKVKSCCQSLVSQTMFTKPSVFLVDC